MAEKKKTKKSKTTIETRQDIAGLWVVLKRGDLEFNLTPYPFAKAHEIETIKEMVKDL